MDIYAETQEHKNEVFKRFQWQAAVEKSSVKTLRSDNGGEYTSTKFTEYLTKEGIKQELTIPHTPQQNGVAGSGLCVDGGCTADSKLPRKFWVNFGQRPYQQHVCISETAARRSQWVR